MSKFIASAVLCVLVSVATAQTITETLVGISSTGEVESWQVEAVKHKGDKCTHWYFQPDERRFRFSDHEWIENTAGTWFRQLVKQRICKVCLRWEVLRWKSHRSNLESTVVDFKGLVRRIEKKKGIE